MCASKIVKRDNVGQILDRALSRRRGIAAADAQLGAAQLLAPRQADQAGPDRLVRPGHASRRHRRALVRQHHRGRQRRPRRPTRA